MWLWQGLKKKGKAKRESDHSDPWLPPRRGGGGEAEPGRVAQHPGDSTREWRGAARLAFLLSPPPPFPPFSLFCWRGWGEERETERKEIFFRSFLTSEPAHGGPWLRCTKGSPARSTPHAPFRRPRRPVAFWVARGRRRMRDRSPSGRRRRRWRPGSAAVLVAGPGSSTRRGATVTRRT